MRYYYNSHIICWPDKFVIKNELGIECYKIETKLSWGHVVKIEDLINQCHYQSVDTITSFFPHFQIKCNDEKIGFIKRRVQLGRIQYEIQFKGFYIRGDFLTSHYDVYKGSQFVASINEINQLCVIETNEKNAHEVISFIITLEAFKSLID